MIKLSSSECELKSKTKNKSQLIKYGWHVLSKGKKRIMNIFCQEFCLNSQGILDKKIEKNKIPSQISKSK